MIGGSELRNSFNRIMRRLYSIKDNSGSAGGFSGTTKINNNTYVDTNIQICYDLLDNYDKVKELSGSQILFFLNEFESSTLHYLGNDIKESTRVQSKNIINEYLDEIKSNYEEQKIISKIEKLKKEVNNFEKKDLFAEYNSKKYDENSEGIVFDKGYDKEKTYYEPPKKDKAPNKIYSKIKELEEYLCKFPISYEDKTSISNRFEDIYYKTETLEGKSSIKSFLKTYISLAKDVLEYNIPSVYFSSGRDYFKHTAKEIEKELLKKRPSLEPNLVSKIDNIQQKITYHNKTETKSHHREDAPSHTTKEKESSWLDKLLIPFVKFLELIKWIFKFITNKKTIIGIVLLCILYFAYVNYDNFKVNSPIDNTIYSMSNDTKQDTILEKPQAPVIEEYALTQLEEDFFNLLNEKRVRYGKSAFSLNIDLSELAKNYLEIYLKDGSDSAKVQIGDLSERKEKSNADKSLIESSYTFTVTGDNIAQTIVDKIVNSNLYNEEYKNIGLAIVQNGNTYNILIDLY